MFQIPKDPMLLLSVINTKLRDQYCDLDVLCEDLEIEKEMITYPLSAIDYEYDPNINQFV